MIAWSSKRPNLILFLIELMLVYKKSNIQSLSESLLEVIDNDVLRKRLSENALFTVTGIYTINAKANNLIKQIIFDVERAN
jgi:hypothetical protein